tara:strand:+ start:118 stop:351 length:234 start_codon:yes stop_codon:yes gene_type:complete
MMLSSVTVYRKPPATRCPHDSMMQAVVAAPRCYAALCCSFSYGKATQPSATLHEASTKQRRSALLRRLVTPCLAGGM